MEVNDKKFEINGISIDFSMGNVIEHLDQMARKLAYDTVAMEAYAFGYINCLWSSGILSRYEYQPLIGKYAPDYQDVREHFDLGSV